MQIIKAIIHYFKCRILNFSLEPESDQEWRAGAEQKRRGETPQDNKHLILMHHSVFFIKQNSVIISIN